MTNSYVPRKHPAMAHIPGGGPPDTMCIQCRHYARKKNQINGECTKATEFRSGHGIVDVPPSMASCKYFEKGVIV